MMRRSSKSTFSDFLRVRAGGCRAAAWLAVLLLGSGGTVLRAQAVVSPDPAAKASATPKPQAYVRFWNMLIGPNAPDLQLLLSEDRPLTVGPSANASAGYLAVDPGTYTFTVRRPNDPNGVIKRLPVALRADVYITLLAAAGKDGKPDVQIINDTTDPKADDSAGKLVVRQFFPSASVTVGVNAPPAGNPLAFGESTTLEGLPLRGTIVNMRASGLGPAPKNWNVEADFATGGHHATMLILPDPYGRFRPRLMFDGSARKPQPAPVSNGASATPTP